MLFRSTLFRSNVWEWCWDWYSSSYSSGSVTNPRGASSGSYRLKRGGSWNNNATNCRTANRNNNNPNNRNNNLGFRLVRSAQHIQIFYAWMGILYGCTEIIVDDYNISNCPNHWCYKKTFLIFVKPKHGSTGRHK